MQYTLHFVDIYQKNYTLHLETEVVCTIIETRFTLLLCTFWVNACQFNTTRGSICLLLIIAYANEHYFHRLFVLFSAYKKIISNARRHARGTN
jgi:hypothetical protein